MREAGRTRPRARSDGPSRSGATRASRRRASGTLGPGRRDRNRQTARGGRRPPKEGPPWQGGTWRGDPFTCHRRQGENGPRGNNRLVDRRRHPEIYGSTAAVDAGATRFARRPRSRDGRIARVLIPASQRYVVLIPSAKSIRSESEIAAVFPEAMICVTSAYGTVKVVMRIARLRLIVYPTLKNVARNPDAIPRRSGGTEPMIELMFGDAKNPRPAPKSIMYATRCEYGVDASVVEKRKSERLMTAKPDVVNGKWPYLSERRPLKGPAARVEISSGIISRPVVSGVCLKTSWKYRLKRRRTAPKAIAFNSWGTTPPVNSRMRRSLRSSRGCAWRRSRTTKTARLPNAATRRARTVLVSVTPYAARVMARSKLMMNTVNVAKPPQSIGAPRSSLPTSRSRKWAHAVPKIPIGTLT